MGTMKAEDRTFKGLLVGYPGTGKTGSLASLINTGRYNVRILDYDGNCDPLYTYVDPQYYTKVDIVTLEDKLQLGKLSGMQTSGPPQAFARGVSLCSEWKYKSADEEEINLGKPSEWGRDTILVVDSLTAMGRAAMRRNLFLQDRVTKGPRIRDWGLAMGDQEAFLEVLTSEYIKCHVIVTAHLKLIGPKMEEESDTENQKEAKEKIQELVPFRLFPSALGRELPPRIGEHFPFLLRYQSKLIGGSKVKRQIVTMPQSEVDLKCPLLDFPQTLDVEDCLVKIFDAIERVNSCLNVIGSWWFQRQQLSVF